MVSIKSNQKGFTLMELLIVLALLGLVLAAGWNLFAVGQKAWYQLQEKLEAEAAVRYACQYISNELDTASYLDIRADDFMWSDNTQIGDRIIYVNAGTITLKEKVSNSNWKEFPLVSLDKGSMDLSVSKPLNTADANKPIDNTLSFGIAALNQNNNPIYESNSAIMLSNMLPNTGVPTGSLNEGNRILYRSTIDRAVITDPGAYGCGGCW